MAAAPRSIVCATTANSSPTLSLIGRTPLIHTTGFRSVRAVAAAAIRGRAPRPRNSRNSGTGSAAWATALRKARARAEAAGSAPATAAKSFASSTYTA